MKKYPRVSSTLSGPSSPTPWPDLLPVGDPRGSQCSLSRGVALIGSFPWSPKLLLPCPCHLCSCSPGLVVSRVSSLGFPRLGPHPGVPLTGSFPCHVQLLYIVNYTQWINSFDLHAFMSHSYVVDNVTPALNQPGNIWADWGSKASFTGAWPPPNFIAIFISRCHVSKLSFFYKDSAGRRNEANDVMEIW